MDSKGRPKYAFGLRDYPLSYSSSSVSPSGREESLSISPYMSPTSIARIERELATQPTKLVIPGYGTISPSGRTTLAEGARMVDLTVVKVGNSEVMVPTSSLKIKKKKKKSVTWGAIESRAIEKRGGRSPTTSTTPSPQLSPLHMRLGNYYSSMVKGGSSTPVKAKEKRTKPRHTLKTSSSLGDDDPIEDSEDDDDARFDLTHRSLSRQERDELKRLQTMSRLAPWQLREKIPEGKFPPHVVNRIIAKYTAEWERRIREDPTL